MSHEMSGSEKLKVQCQTMASLTPEEISQIAGAGLQLDLFHFFPNGIPAFWLKPIGQINPTTF